MQPYNLHEQRTNAEQERHDGVVAVAEEDVKCLMADQDKNARDRKWRAQERRRALVLKHARELARSGRYAGSESIIAELEAMEAFKDVRDRLKSPMLRAQLDRLCDVARKTSPR